VLNEFLKEHKKVAGTGVAARTTAKTNRIVGGDFAESQRPN
jgi:hypothetical protein